MQPERLAHFKNILLNQLRQHTEHIRQDQADALELSDNDAKDTVDLSVMDVNKEMALRLGERVRGMIVIDSLGNGSRGTHRRRQQA